MAWHRWTLAHWDDPESRNLEVGFIWCKIPPSTWLHIQGHFMLLGGHTKNVVLAQRCCVVQRPRQ